MEKLNIKLKKKLFEYFMLPIALTSTTVLAQPIEFTTMPPQLNVIGVKGSVVVRSIFVKTPKPLESVQLIPPQLNNSDGTEILSLETVKAPGILPQQSSYSCEDSTFQTVATTSEYHEAIVPVCFDLDKSSQGEFSGKLRLSYQGGELFIPIILKVKDNWQLPLVILFLGTVMGFAVSSYRDQGKPRDEVLVRIGRIRAEMQEDTELVKASSFQAEIESHLYDVKVGLQGDKLELARTGIEQAEQVWAKWIKGRDDWLAQLAYWQELKQPLQDKNPNIPYIQTLNREMENLNREVSRLDEPNQLRSRLDELAGQINRFLQVEAFGKQLRDLLGLTTEKEKAKWESKILAWERQINRIQPSELTQDETLVAEMEGAIAEMTQLVAQQSGTSGMAKGILSIPHLAPAPSARPLSWEQQVSGAGVRLRWFTGVSYAIALLFLTGAGFNQLYVDNPTFGANPWKDYFALLAWGFGAEATRDSITKMVQGWGLRGIK